MEEITDDSTAKSLSHRSAPQRTRSPQRILRKKLSALCTHTSRLQLNRLFSVDSLMFKPYHLLIGCLSLSLILTACSPSSPGLPTPLSPSAGPDQAEQPEYVRAARQALATAKGFQLNEISLVSVEAVDWSDACLGLAGSDEMCAQVITPGYRIILKVGEAEFEFHTDATGQSVRQKTE
jgi:hypothetical protein